MLTRVTSSSPHWRLGTILTRPKYRPSAHWCTSSIKMLPTALTFGIRRRRYWLPVSGAPPISASCCTVFSSVKAPRHCFPGPRPGASKGKPPYPNGKAGLRRQTRPPYAPGGGGASRLRRAPVWLFEAQRVGHPVRCAVGVVLHDAVVAKGEQLAAVRLLQPGHVAHHRRVVEDQRAGAAVDR